MAIICGKSGHAHETVAEVKSCQTRPVPSPQFVQGPPVAADRSARPRYPSFAELGAQVPEGRYAVVSATGNNDLDFFTVEKPAEGKWKGYTFVDRVVGGNPDIPLRGAQAAAALKAIIAAGPEQAEILYAQEIARCRFCNRSLTRRIPRFNGQGNDCAADRGLVQVDPPADWRPEIQDEA